MERYVGLDVHSKRSSFAIQDAAGKLVGEGSVTTTLEGFEGMRQRYNLAPGTPVAIETGNVSFHASDLLCALGLKPLVIDAAEVRAKASRPNQKSDRRDAFELAEGLRRDQYRKIVSVPPKDIRESREMLSRRRHFVRLGTSQVNAAKRLLRSVGLGELVRTLQSKKAWERLIASLAGDPTLQAHVMSHHAVWTCAREQVGKIEDQLETVMADRQPQLDRLMTVPGVGSIVARTFMAVVYDAKRFPDAKKVASYAGLVPTTFQSADRNRQGHITRCGSTELRSMLCEAAHHARRTTSPLKRFFTRVFFKRGYRMAVVAVAHRLCRMLYAILRDGTEFDPGKVGAEERHTAQAVV
jgi:transposase